MRPLACLLLPALLASPVAHAGMLERILDQKGALDKRDMTLPGGEWAEVFPIELAAGDRVLVEMESRKLDTFVVLKSPGGEVFENDDTGRAGFSQIDLNVEESGTWLVYATSSRAGEKGPYALRVSVDRSRRGGGQDNKGGAQLSLGGAVDGVLQSGDNVLDNGEWVDLYELELQGGQQVTIDMRSDTLDTFLGLRSPSGAIDGNDDFDGSNRHSRVQTTVQESGTWTVYATTYQAGDGGAYTLSASLDGAGGESGVERFSGTLASGDRQLNGGEYMDAVQLQGQAGERWIVDLRSSAFDPFLIVKGPDGEQLENDDFEGANDRSLIDVTLPATGTWNIAVTTYRAGESGAYDLTVRRVGADDAATADSQQHRGSLEAGDATLQNGEWVDTYTFQAVPGQRVAIDMRGGFDTYLGLIGPNGFREENDDGDDAHHSHIEAVLPEAGTYTVGATSFQAGQGGAYTLDIALSQDTPQETAQRDVQRLTAGQGVVGTLEDGDMTLDGGEWQDMYVIDVEAGQDLAINLSSRDFDPYLGLVLPDGSILQNDDWQGSSELSRIELSAPVSGRYRVHATSYRAGSTGNYRLDATVGQGAITMAAPTTSSAGRIHGIFVGISDYPDDGPGDLDFTAEDARQLALGMQSIGMAPADGRVLTDSAATRAALQAAIADVAAQMGDNDRLVLFYSGHGGRIDHQGAFQAADPDGYDETLALYDGEVTDDELAALLDTIEHGTVLVVLDSCFSGGFSKDLISRPGRMGLFSSHEDVTSAVAQKFKAGGYLARFMVEAIGERKADDGDGQLTALELSMYLYERYRSDVKSPPQEKSGAYSDIVMTGQNLGYQQIIVDRGGVGPSQVLFAW